MSDVIAEHRYATATPASTVREGTSWPVSPLARTSTSPNETSAPMNAPEESAIVAVPRPSRMTLAAPTEAPAEMPSRYGSASGFRITACMTVPITASPPPTSPASSTRGSRSSQTMASRVALSPDGPARPR